MVLSVSAPGGAARHYRVQTLAGNGKWQLQGAFRTATLADKCAAELRAKGLNARVVHYQALPTAA